MQCQGTALLLWEGSQDGLTLVGEGCATRQHTREPGMWRSQGIWGQELPSGHHFVQERLRDCLHPNPVPNWGDSAPGPLAPFS